MPLVYDHLLELPKICRIDKCVLERAHLVQNASQRPQVRFPAISFTSKYFGRHILSCPNIWRSFAILFKNRADPEITQLKNAITSYKDIRGLDVSVDTIAIMNVFNGQAYLGKSVKNLILI